MHKDRQKKKPFGKIKAVSGCKYEGAKQSHRARKKDGN